MKQYHLCMSSKLPKMDSVHNTNLEIMFVLSMCILCCTCSTQSDSEALYDNLLAGYHRHVRPSINQSEPTQINVSFSIVNMNGFDEKTGRFTIVGFFLLSWIDERLSWNPQNYNNTLRIHYPFDKVWVPDLMSGNSYDKIIDIFSNGRVVLLNDRGEVIWKPGNVFEMTCVANIAYYPFDVQQCSFGFLPWGYGIQDLLFNVVSEELTVGYFSPNGKWDITSSKLYSQIVFGDQILWIKFDFKRRSRYEVINTIGPIILLGILQVFVFFIPVESGERIGFATTMLLAITVYMTMVSERLPDISYPEISYLSYFLLSDVISGILLTVCVIQTLRFYHTPETQHYPYWITCLRKAYRNRIIKVTPNAMDNVNDGQSVKAHDISAASNAKQEEEKQETPHITWQIISGYFDKFYICCFLFFCMTRAIVLFVVLDPNL